jgi:hypothetical protein
MYSNHLGFGCDNLVSNNNLLQLMRGCQSGADRRLSPLMLQVQILVGPVPHVTAHVFSGVSSFLLHYIAKNKQNHNITANMNEQQFEE